MSLRTFAILASLVGTSLAAPIAAAAAKARVVEISVTEKGFEPNRIAVQKGEPLKLVVTRRTDQTCAKEITIPDESVRKLLPLNQAVEIELTPKKAGELTYACGMKMLTGVLVVR